MQYTVKRNVDGGFGFSISAGGRSDSVRVCRVDRLSHAWHVGLQVDDELLNVDSMTVTRLPVNSVAAVIRLAPVTVYAISYLALYLQRSKSSVPLRHCKTSLSSRGYWLSLHLRLQSRSLGQFKRLLKAFFCLACETTAPCAISLKCAA